MSQYNACVTWELDKASFSDKKYSRAHTWHFDGGLSVAASASPHIVPEPFSNPANVDPEEAFVASLASCHMLFFLDLAAQANLVVEHYEDNAIGKLAKNAEGVMMMTEVVLNPAATFAGDSQPNDEQIQALHHQAHELCFIANSVHTQITVSPK